MPLTELHAKVVEGVVHHVPRSTQDALGFLMVQLVFTVSFVESVWDALLPSGLRSVKKSLT